MALPDVVTREEWLAARKALLAREKQMTRELDRLNADRRRLPMVRVDRDYRFEGEDGEATLLDLFGPARQLVVQHFMFDPSWDDGCSSCTAAADEISAGFLRHLEARATKFVMVSRAPYPKLRRYGQARGWDIPWFSSYGSSFNYDFHVTLDGSVAPVMFNYRDAAELDAAGFGWVNEGSNEQPGYSCFLRDGDEVFHTYSTFGRGTEQLGGAYAMLDMTALGRQEQWEEPKGRADGAREAIPNFGD